MLNVLGRAVRRLIGLQVVLLTVAGCGGGGGSASGGPNGDPGFRIDRNSVALVREGSLPSTVQQVLVTVEGSQVAAMAYGYPPGMNIPAWLQVSAGQSSAGMTLSLSSTAGGVAIGTYDTTVRIGSFDRNDDLIGFRDVAVSLVVQEATLVDAPALNFSYILGAAVPAGKTIGLTMPAARSWNAAATQPWVTLSPASGVGSASVSVGVDPTGLAAGVHNGNVTVTAGAGTTTRPVSLTVQLPVIEVQPAGVQLSELTGAAQRATANIALSYSSGQAEAWSLVSQPAWLTLNKSTGTTPDNLIATASASLAQSGSYSGTIVVANSAGRQTSVPVSLNVVGPSLQLGATTVSFSGVNGVPIAAKTMTVQLSDGTVGTWSATSSVPWLKLNGSAATTTALSMSIDATTPMATGTHSTSVPVTVQWDGRSLSGNVAVALELTPPVLTSSPASLALTELTGAAQRTTSNIALNYTNGQALAWSLVSKPAWLTLNKSAGTTPDNLIATPTASLEQSGSYSGAIVLADNLGRETSLPVSLNVVGPSLQLGAATVSFSGINGAPMAAKTMTVQLSDGTVGTWSATSSVPWLQLNGSAATTTALSMSIDAATPKLASGSYSTSVPVTVQWDGRSLSGSVPVTLALTPAVLTSSAGSLAFGGANGRNFSAAPLSLTLNTGSNAHAWTATGLPAWLQLAPAGGSVSGTPSTLTFTPDASKATPGVSSANLTLTAKVNGDTLSSAVAVTFGRDEHRLLASDNGVAFSSTPSWSRLTRTLTVSDNFNRPTGWAASSNQPWLSVTPSGTSGGSLVLTANPAGLAFDQVHSATVTIASADADAQGDVVKVGLWVGSATPAAVVSVAGGWKQARPDPVRPLVYVHDGGTDVFVYNVYTGLQVGRVANAAPTLGSMAVSSDGSTLYAIDATQARIVPIDLNSLAVGAAFTPLGSWTGPQWTVLNYARVNGTGILLGSATGYAVAGSTLKHRFAASTDTLVHAFDRAGKTMVTINTGTSPFTATRYAIDYSAVVGTGNSPVWLSSVTGTLPSPGGNGKEIAISADAGMMYTASGAPYNFPRYDGITLVQQGALPGDAYPASVKVASDGRIFAAASVLYNGFDWWVYGTDAVQKASGKASGYAKSILDRQFWPSGDALMGIALSDDPILKFVPIGP
jgi:Viral BACON domain